MNDQEAYKPLLEALREAPTELSVEDVDRMVVGFPLMPAPFDWTSIFSLKSIIMTSISALFIAGAISLLSGESKSGTLEVRSYQEETQSTAPIISDSLENQKEPEQEKSSNALLAEQFDAQVPAPKPDPKPVQSPAPAAIPPVAQAQPPVNPVHPETRTPNVPPVAEIPNLPPGDKSYDLKDFTKVGLQCAVDVHIQYGSSFQVEAHGDKDVLEKLDLYVKNGQLTIDMKQERGNWNNNSCDDKSATIEVRMPDLDVVNLAGSGNIHIDGFKSLDELQLNLAGSGDIHGSDDVKIAKSLDASIAGSGDIAWSGTANSLDISIAGSGDFQGEGLRVESAHVSISGSGDVTLGCDKDLNVSIAGSGDVNYKGNATVKKSVIGSGDVNHY